MSKPEIAFFIVYWVLAGTGLVWVMRKLWRYTSGRVAESEKLADEGWILMGWDFITGPVMVPPEAVLPPHLAQKWREAARRNAAGAPDANP